MKTAIYIRVSTEEQVKEGYSISAQLQKLKAFCISQEWEVAGIYADEGISAKDMKRPELQRMLKDIKEEKVECVLVYRLDRLTRSVFDLYKLLEVFEGYDCKFKSATEVYDTTTAMGRMFITIVAALAQWERENMGERISFGFVEKARQGKYAHNFAPIGYDLNKEESKLYINEKESETVKKIYHLYQSGHGFGRVAKELNKRGIYTKEGNEWTDNTTMKIIRNPVYYGASRWLEIIVDNTHEAIIDKKEWLETQKIIEDRRSRAPRSISSNYIFSGKLKCNCGGNMQGYYTTPSNVKKSNIRYNQYRCRNKRNGRCASSRSISESKLERAFIEYLENESYVETFNEISAAIEIEEKAPEIDVNKLNKELSKLEQRKKKWQYAWSEDVMDYEDFKKRMAETKKEEDEIKSVLGTIKEEIPEERINKEEIISMLKDIRKNWIFLEKQEKKNLVHSIIEQVHVTQVGKHLSITGISFK